MKRLLTAAVLCTVLILGSVWSVRAVDNTAQAVALDVENDRLNEARETWDAAQTLLGTAALLLETGKHPGELKDAVCSPAGSTIAGVRALENGSFRADVMNAVIAAFERTKELGN